MKTLPYLKLVTNMGSWDGVILEGDIEVNNLTWIIS
jgi:hypothetical protein